MKLCGESCIQICDFCKNYHDDGGDIRVPGGFVGEGTCGITNKHVDATEGRNCDDFHCFNCD